MKAIARRLQCHESRGTDTTGLVPYSKAWCDFREENFERVMNGENVRGAKLSLDVTDRIIAAADREEAEGAAAGLP